MGGWREARINIYEWWGLGGVWNIGILTGAVSGILALDVDPRNDGDETLANLQRRHGPLPETWRFLSGGGGEHILFRHPGGYVKSVSNAIGAGLDIKADGGFIVAPPSRHVFGRRYAISVDHHPDDVPLAHAPPWLLDMLDREKSEASRSEEKSRAGRSSRPERPVPPSHGLSPYGDAALDSACRRIMDAPPGRQEATLNAEAYSIGRLAGAGAVPAGFALKVLQYAASQVRSYDLDRPWRADDLAAKVERSFLDGTSKPRLVRR